jgi:glucosamine-6-phosphate deaminase
MRVLPLKKGIWEMNVTPVRRFESAIALGEALAHKIADLLEAKLEGGERFVLGCPGGRTPSSTYAALAVEIAKRGIDRRMIIIAMMDDYVRFDGSNWAHVAGDSHNSCRRFAYEEIQGVLNRGANRGQELPDVNVWFPDPQHPGEYDERLMAVGGVDFFILASGAGDGHVAFNPPGSALTSRTRIVELAEQTRRDNLVTFPGFSDITEVPTHGVTVGIATIAELSSAGAMVLIGADKRKAYAQLTNGDKYESGWPATVYHLIPGAELYVDSEAIGHEA